jgi:hypothetical protein
MYAPFVGIIVNYILIRQQKQIDKEQQLSKNPDWKPKKKAMPIQILLLVITIILVLTI